MGMTLYDVQTGFGGAVAGEPGILTADALRDEMRRLEIARGVARVVPETMEFDIPAGNTRLYAACAEDDLLIPCPVVAPNSGGDLAEEAAQADEAIRHGAWAVWIRPAQDYWLLAEWVCDDLFRALQERRLPVLCLERLVAPEQLAALAGRYPALPFILAEGSYRNQRIYLPLLETFPNIYLSTGNNNIVYQGIEQMVRRVGAERLLFGTGFPGTEPMTAVTHLMYADLADDQRQLIGAGNLLRLKEGIR